MENLDSNKSLFDINFDENVKQELKSAAKWGGIAAIVSIVGSALGVVSYFVEKSRMNNQFDGYESIRSQQRAAETGGFITVFITLLIGIALFVFLNKFSRKAKAGIELNDQYLINEGLGGLSTYFKIIGVLFIIAIVFVGLVLLIGIGQGI